MNVKFNQKHIEALDLRFSSDAGDDITIRDYFFILLRTLWDEGEGFSGKRPFGNSGWEFELYAPLIKHKYIAGSLDSEYGYVATMQGTAADFVSHMIEAAFYGK